MAVRDRNRRGRATSGLGLGVASVAATDWGSSVDDPIKSTAGGILNTTAQLGTGLRTAVIVLASTALTPRLAWLPAAALAAAPPSSPSEAAAHGGSVIMAAVEMAPDLITRYRRYLACCNERSWDELRSFVAARVLVNGRMLCQEQYIDDIRATLQVFPDYQWVLHRVIREDDWLAVHLRATGTRTRPFLDAPGDGAYVETDEFDIYRFADGIIIELEGTADNARLAR